MPALTWPFVIEHSAREKKETQLKPWHGRLQDQPCHFDRFYALLFEAAHAGHDCAGKHVHDNAASFA
jgi:hypothetical protein